MGIPGGRTIWMFGEIPKDWFDESIVGRHWHGGFPRILGCSPSRSV
jgi:hypothetical protein